MSNVFKSITEIIGNTPIMELCRYQKENNINSRIIAKLEYFNPAGSAKDRVAYSMIKEAEKKGILKNNSVIIEPTSGNTGIGLAAVGCSRGYKVILTMPESMSVERRKLLKAYGAEIILTKASKGMQGAIDKANEIAKEYENSFIPMQFENGDNPKIHFNTTAPEIWNDTEGKVDIFVAGIGTGGTITGVGEFLKSKNPNIEIVAVEPFNSPMLTYGRSGSHKIQGIGANFVPKVLNREIIDEIVMVKDEDAIQTAKQIAKTEGLLVGISSGAALWAAQMLSKRSKNANKNIVVFMPDTGERYLSSDMFD